MTRGGKVPIYPTIHDVYEGRESVRYTFTLPNGVDPAQIHTKWFCFQQILGENLMMEGDIKKFVLHVFHSNASLQPYDYSYKQWQPLLKPYRLPVVVGRDQFNCSLHSCASLVLLIGSCSQRMRQKRYSLLKIFGTFINIPPNKFNALNLCV